MKKIMTISIVVVLALMLGISGVYAQRHGLPVVISSSNHALNERWSDGGANVSYRSFRPEGDTRTSRYYGTEREHRPYRSIGAAPRGSVAAISSSNHILNGPLPVK